MRQDLAEQRHVGGRLDPGHLLEVLPATDRLERAHDGDPDRLGILVFAAWLAAAAGRLALHLFTLWPRHL